MAPLARPFTTSFSRRPGIKISTGAASRTTPARSFATAVHGDEFLKQANGHSPDQHHGRRRPRDPHHHHHVWPASPNPTPYEILGLHKKAAYQKTIFYALVKQYHPDLHHAAPDHLQDVSPTERLERYRLIVAANDLLSHTGRRRMYDVYGMGWTPAKVERSDEQARQTDRAWRTRKNTAAYNATWEDWERWRQENGGGASGDGANAKQAEQFMSNGGFALVVLVMMCIGGWGQMMRATSNGASILEMRDQNHKAIAGMLRDRQTADAALSRQDRVGSFLERREGWSGYDMGLGTSPSRVGNRKPGED